jgi:hypothetical protein
MLIIKINKYIYIYILAEIALKKNNFAKTRLQERRVPYKYVHI